MSFFKKLGNLLAGPQRMDDPSFWFTVQCKRCGEKIRGRVDMRNDLSQQYDTHRSGADLRCEPQAGRPPDPGGRLRRRGLRNSGSRKS